MSRQQSPASYASPASILLPRAAVIPLPAAKRTRVVDGCGFTKATVRKMHCPPERTERFFWDANCPGLGIRALCSGRRSWIFQYRDKYGRTRRIALGDVSIVGLDDARNEARRKAASVMHGENPSAERKAKRASGTLLDLIDAYLLQAKGRLRPRSYKETDRNLRMHAAGLHHERVEARPSSGGATVNDALSGVAIVLVFEICLWGGADRCCRTGTFVDSAGLSTGGTAFS